MIKLAIEQTSVTSTINNLKSKEQEIIQAGYVGLHNAANIIFANSQATMPKRTGALSASGKVTMLNAGAFSEATISYGDQTRNTTTGKTTASYAVEKHEDPVNGKWLEHAILNGSELFINTIQAEISKHM